MQDETPKTTATDGSMRALDAATANHVADGWSLVTQMGKHAVLTFGTPDQGGTRRQLTVGDAGQVLYKDPHHAEFQPLPDPEVVRLERAAVRTASIRASRRRGWIATAVVVPLIVCTSAALSLTSRREPQFYDRFPNADRAVDIADNLTLDEFLRIQLGMSYAEVVGVVGRAGTLTVSSDSGGRIYSWKRARCCANMSVHLRYDRVISKSQAGLD